MSLKKFIKTDTELDSMRISGKMLATILKQLEAKVEVGMTPKDLSKFASEELKKLGGEPVFKGFHGFPDIICISVNDQVQHSIPTSVPINEGDIVNFDFGVKYRGMITDAGVTVVVGKYLNANDERLVKGTLEARDSALDIIKGGIRVGDVSAHIENILNKHHLGIVRELVGHGVGRELHEEPEIANYGRAGTGPVLLSGMTVAIEPITTLGSPDIYMEKDGWTLRTWDKSNSAQFEHTVLILDNGVEILTQI